MKQNLSLVILALLGLVSLCVAQTSTTSPPITERNETSPSESPSLSETTSPSVSTSQTEATSPSVSTNQTEATSPSLSTNQTETTPTAGNTTGSTVAATDMQTSPTDSTVGAGDPGLSDGAIAGIAIGSIAGVAAVGGGVFGILKKTGKI